MNSATSQFGHSRRPSAPRRGGRPSVQHQPAANRAPARPVIALEPAPFDPTPVPFASLGLDERLAKAVEGLGFELTTPVQSAVFPAVASGMDLVACAQTGTGKTIAFLLPVLQRMLASADATVRRVGPRALILVPTRELAVQIEDDVRVLIKHTRITGVSVYGGVGMGAQARALRAHVDIIVATPGRLLDHMNQGRGIDYSGLDVLVLDEADRMLDMGFWNDVQRIVAALPTTRQTLLFSATTSQDVVKAAAQIMRDPKLMQVGKSGGLASTITHVSHIVPTDSKATWVDKFLAGTTGQTLVFMRTKHRADRLVRRLADSGHRCAPLHANRSQSQRLAAIDGFRDGKFRILVATDIAARGIDVDGIGHVINFEVPATADTYVHRVGRTGRAEATGTAVTLVAPEEMGAFRSIERTLNLKIGRPAGAGA